MFGIQFKISQAFVAFIEYKLQTDLFLVYVSMSFFRSECPAYDFYSDSGDLHNVTGIADQVQVAHHPLVSHYTVWRSWWKEKKTLLLHMICNTGHRYGGTSTYTSIILVVLLVGSTTVLASSMSYDELCDEIVVHARAAAHYHNEGNGEQAEREHMVWSYVIHELP